MHTLCFATNNQHKLQEIQHMLGEKFSLLTLYDIGCHEDIAETGATLEANSLLKAQYVWQHYNIDCFADDTGLEVTALNGAPGVYSARYAGVAHDFAANNALLLRNLAAAHDRSARFRSVITLILKGNVWQFEGIVEGSIIHTQKGTEGFGYDPLFVPKGYQETFAQMSLDQKNQLSHRARAFEKLIQFLNKFDTD